MRGYKRFMTGVVLLSVFAGVFAHGACAARAAQKEIKVVASFYPVYIMARNVIKGVPGVSLENLTPPFTGCLHDYTLTTADMKKLAGAQALIVNGAGMESFLEEVAVRHPGLRIIGVSDGMSLIKSGDEENPHIWVGISGAVKQVENLGAAMQSLDPAHKELYAQNTAGYVAKLNSLREQMHAQLAAYKGRKIITFHEAFPYFAEEFELEIAAVVEREPGSEPSAKELAETIDLIRTSGKDGCVLFSEPQYPSSSAETIAAETGLKVYVLDPAVSGQDEDDAYLKIMEKNLEVLKDAFRK